MLAIDPLSGFGERSPSLSLSVKVLILPINLTLADVCFSGMKTDSINDGNVMNNGEKHTDSNEVVFSEPYAAAQSLKNFWTRLASTYGCMRVVLSREALTIKPHWFAKWLICLLGLDLCHEIPISSIRGATEMRKWFSYGKVELHFMTIDGEDRRILLYMKKYREFLDALKNTTSASS